MAQYEFAVFVLVY